MDSDELASRLATWAEQHDSVEAIWLFGSRARGDNRPDSDFDIALELAPKKGDHDWAFGNFCFLWKEWKVEIIELIGARIDLICFRDDLIGKFDPRHKGILLWSRHMPPCG